MTLSHIIILAVIQGLAELLPVSSSAHVIAAARLLKLDPTTPDFTLMLVMLHTGTMFAVIVYFWRAWLRTFFSSQDQFIRFATKIVVATGITGVIGLGLQKGIEHFLDPGYTGLVTWSMSDSRSGHPTPTSQTLLTNLVASAAPDMRLFSVGETLTLNVEKNGEPLPYQQITVKPKSTLGDLLAVFNKGFGINTMARPSKKNIPQPGIELLADKDHPNAVKIEIIGNEGRANRLKMGKDGFVDTAEQTRLGFLDTTKGEIEQLFKRMDLIAGALAAAGVLILIAGVVGKKSERRGITTADGAWLGFIQGLSLPFRGFSRSGVTISLGLLRGINRQRAEEFSFAMAVALTPAALGYEAYRMYERVKQSSPVGLGVHDLMPGVKGMLYSFLAGLIALKLLSKLLEKGQWWIFGVYCLAAAVGVYCIGARL